MLSASPSASRILRTHRRRGAGASLASGHGARQAPLLEGQGSRFLDLRPEAQSGPGEGEAGGGEGEGRQEGYRPQYFRATGMKNNGRTPPAPGTPAGSRGVWGENGVPLPLLPQGPTGEQMMPTDTGIPVPKTDPPHAGPTLPSLWVHPAPTPPISPASSRPPAASQPRLHSGGTALPSGCQGKAPPKGGRCTPSSPAPPGIRKQRSEEEGESGHPGTMPTALCPQPQPRPPGPPAPGAGIHPKPPSSCHLAFPHPQCHTAGTGTSSPFVGCGGLSPIHPWCHLAPPTFGATPPESFSLDKLCRPASGGVSGSGFKSPQPL